jgi:hypothetical protein
LAGTPGQIGHRRLPARNVLHIAQGSGDLWRVPMAEQLRATHRTFTSLTPARVITGVAVFAFGVLAGAAIAAWVMPPS